MKHIWVFAGLLPLVVTGCTAEWIIPEDYVLECEQDADCPGEQTCNLESKACVDPNQPICGNGVIEFGEACDAGQYNTDSYTTPAVNISPCNASCSGASPHCGDGVLNGEEECDNGTANDNQVPDACREDCSNPICGDGVVDTGDGEACDAGEENTDAYGEPGRCNSACIGEAPSWGDGIINGGETCDEGAANTNAYGEGGRCNLNCNGEAPHCGDGEINGGEVCDAGFENNTDDYGIAERCNSSCTGYAGYCGDGFVDVEEDCDDGEANTDAYGELNRCNGECTGQAPSCGDGITNGGESCDEGLANTNAYGGPGRCNLSCNGDAPHCGDAIVNGGEFCDLGSENNTDTYGGPNRCNTACTGFASHCGDNVQDATEACDDGNVLGDDYCAPDCSAVTTVCGDGIVAGDEVCDDGPSNADGYFPGATAQCNSTCTGIRPYCGDGNRTDDEVCDAGTQNVDAESYSQNPSCTTSCDGFNKHCGDDEVTDGEVCDEGHLNSDQYEFYQHCNGSCSGQYPAYCGDGLVQATLGETCDDGNDITTDMCPSGSNGSCMAAVCGDGFHWEGYELCDDGNQDEDDDCSALCGATMVAVPAGNFWMGCNEAVDVECDADESPYHEVYLSDFAIDKTEVRAGAYKACVDAGVCAYNGDTGGYYTYDHNMENHPINGVNWYEANTYCEWLGKRLPTEAEWEKAARGIDGRKYPWGNSPDASCTHLVMDEGGDGCGTAQTWEVGSKPLGASPYGAMDMAGNVWEWTADWYSSDYYEQTPVEGWVNPEGPVSGVYRVLRGGSWLNFDPVLLNSSFRNFLTPANRFSYLGFRCSQ